MGNMSYCRFQNTANDLKDCVDELFSYGVDDDMSMRELKLRNKKIKIKYYGKDERKIYGRASAR